jgi:hypothetical protein
MAGVQVGATAGVGVAVGGKRVGVSVVSGASVAVEFPATARAVALGGTPVGGDGDRVSGPCCLHARRPDSSRNGITNQ